MNEGRYKNKPLESVSLLKMQPVAEIAFSIPSNISGKEYAQIVLSKIGYQSYKGIKIDAQSLDDYLGHRVNGNPYKLNGVLSVPSIITKGVVIYKWGVGHNDPRESGMVAAPIMINGSRAYCVVVSKRNNDGHKRFYDLCIFKESTLKKKIREKLESGASITTLSASRENADSTSTEIDVANVLTNYIISNSSEEEIKNFIGIMALPSLSGNSSPSSAPAIISPIPESKQQIRITESDLRDIIQESVIRVLEESSQKCGPNGYHIMKRGVDYKYKGEKCHSKISVVNKWGNQRYHVDEDDGCYVLYWDEDNNDAEIYENPYIFDELLDAIKMLPPLS